MVRFSESILLLSCFFPQQLEDNQLETRKSSNANTLFIGNLNKNWTKVCMYVRMLIG